MPGIILLFQESLLRYRLKDFRVLHMNKNTSGLFFFPLCGPGSKYDYIHCCINRKLALTLILKTYISTVRKILLKVLPSPPPRAFFFPQKRQTFISGNVYIHSHLSVVQVTVVCTGLQGQLQKVISVIKSRKEARECRKLIQSLVHKDPARPLAQLQQGEQ